MGRPAMLVAGALLAVYLIWGSTFLAILFAIQTIPPFMMAGVRFLVAGTLLYAMLRFRGHGAPSRAHWLAAAGTGALILGVGNGGVTWAEQHVPSGVAALILAGIPAWMVLLDWIRPGGRRPGAGVLVGVAVGLAGIALLVFAGGEMRSARVDLLGAAVVVIASLGWASGSILSRSLSLPASAMLLTAMQMIAAGVLLLGLGALSGELPMLDLAEVTGRSILALAYLIVFGSWAGYGAYVWLLRSTTPAVASTYAYVNPAIAVLLGWLFAGEPLDGGMVVAMAVTMSGVLLITLRRSRPPPERTRSGQDRMPAPAGPSGAEIAPGGGRAGRRRLRRAS